jgi:predicted Ser/Thr protein kinase
MALTPASLRLDLKCGKGAISEGEKCTKGPATKVEEKPGEKDSKKGELTKGQKQRLVVGYAVYATLTAASLYQMRNMRKAYGEKFDPAQRYKPFTEDIGGVKNVLQEMVVKRDKTAGPSLFGDVVFGTHKGKNIVAKTVGGKGAAGAMQIRMMEKQGVITADTSDALIKAQQKLQVNEVQAAQLAGKHGFGPKFVAAGDNTLITEAARGRPLTSQDRALRYALGKGQKEAADNPAKFLQKMAALRMRGLTKGTEISSTNKARIVENLARMHTLGVAHNDLHPGNVFVSSKGAEFIDYGTSERGGSAVASEFVRLMNKPRFGLQQSGGMGYNLKTVNPTAYKNAEREIKKAIGKRVGSITSADIRKAVEKSNKASDLEASLQNIVDKYYEDLAKASRSDAAGVPCGESHIPRGRTCRKKGGGFPTRTAVAAGLTAAALGAGALAYSRRRTRIQPVKVTVLPHTPGSTERGAPRLPGSRDPDMPLLPGITPRALLMPARKRKSKTQRMRENTAASMRTAEKRIAQTAREEVRRLGQIGNTMAAAGEAAGNAAKTTTREVRLRTEAARRRFEPGYRRPDQKRLPESEMLTPLALMAFPDLMPTTIKAPVSRRKPRGFGRQDAASKTVFVNKKLHAAVKAEAKRKFKIYPSAYANAWMVREYKERGGEFRSDALDKWFKEKWVRMSSSGRILGPCGDRSEGEGKPKCLPAAKAAALSSTERRRLVARKRREDPRKERTGGPVMVSSKTDLWATGFDAEDGKKYSKKVRDPKTGRTRTVRYGAKGYKIAPGTSKGDRYCARSFGDMKSHSKDCSGKDRNTPLCLSRAKWRCSGKVSRRDGLTPGKSSAW